MINWRRLSSLLLISLFLILVSLSCKEEQLEEKYVAKVGNSKLTEDELNTYFDSSRFGNKYKEEIIREWIDKEILYQEALEAGLDKDPLFKRVTELNEKELLAALLLQKELNSQYATTSDEELKKYFSENIEEFKLNHQAVLINRANFSDEETAINFRDALLAKGWNYSLYLFQNDSSFVSSSLDYFTYKYQLRSAKLLRVIDELLPGEFSIVIESEPNHFSIVQLIKSFEANEIPEFEFVKNLVKQRFPIQKKKELYAEYLKNLYTKYNVEIVRTN